MNDLSLAEKEAILRDNPELRLDELAIEVVRGMRLEDAYDPENAEIDEVINGMRLHNVDVFSIYTIASSEPGQVDAIVVRFPHPGEVKVN